MISLKPSPKFHGFKEISDAQQGLVHTEAQRLTPVSIKEGNRDSRKQAQTDPFCYREHGSQFPYLHGTRFSGITSVQN